MKKITWLTALCAVLMVRGQAFAQNHNTTEHVAPKEKIGSVVSLDVYAHDDILDPVVATPVDKLTRECCWNKMIWLRPGESHLLYRDKDVKADFPRVLAVSDGFVAFRTEKGKDGMVAWRMKRLDLAESSRSES